MGTQIASLLAGTLDLIVPVEIDQATSLKADARFQLTQTQGINYYYWAIDSTGRAGNKALLDSRVRRALMMAVDRSKLIGVITGDDSFPRVPPAICWAEQQGCGITEKYPAYDPASARRLLAEAGYPNGFEMQITCASGATHRINAEILSGFFGKIGVKASVEVTTRPVYQRKQRDGELQMYTAGWTAGGMPDVAGIVSFFLSPEESSRYHDDKTLRTLADESMQMMDLEKRRKLAGQAFDRAAQEGYFYAFAPYPMAIVHKKEIDVQDRRRYSAFGFEPQDVRWK
jgi:peptide/nickel transport system substrate-binding protein